MTFRPMRQTSVALFVCLLAAPCSLAQSAWQVTVNPTLNPLPIGLCGAVQLTVRDASGTDTPRNPLGARLSIADFDMTVAAPGKRSVAGQQIDAAHWSVCACSGATVGATATVTASYPAQSLPSAARVPGVVLQKTATFVIAAAKGANPSACSAPAPTPAAPSAPASVRGSSAPATGAATSANNSKPASSPAPAPPAAPAKPATPAQPAVPPPPGPTPQIPSFPQTPADWAALQKELGESGWADMQKVLDDLFVEAHEPEQEKMPPELATMVGGRNHAMAVAEFKKMLPVLRHGRCINCHQHVTYFDDPDNESFPKATHQGGDINEIDLGVKDQYGNQQVKFSPCKDCHTKAPPAWENSGPEWTGLDDYQMCQAMKAAAPNGANLLGHLLTDDLVKLAFVGQRAMDGLTPKPPPLSHSEFLAVTAAWINRMDARKQWPKARSEGCPRTDKWSGAIEYTYTEVTKLDRFESHGAVHIVGGRAKWSALAARQEDHSAKNCPSVFSASAAGQGTMELVTIDHTSETPVTGFKMPDLKHPPAATKSQGFVALTIFPGIYSFAIDLPMSGSGRYQGGGSACPGYRSNVQEFSAKIGESAHGKFDPDNPDELSGTKTESPFPGATITLKWQFMRQDEAR
ncbi:MAG: hypothetical protein ABI769_03515 [Pseudomonadota bacterium]